MLKNFPACVPKEEKSVWSGELTESSSIECLKTCKWIGKASQQAGDAGEQVVQQVQVKTEKLSRAQGKALQKEEK